MAGQERPCELVEREREEEKERVSGKEIAREGGRVHRENRENASKTERENWQIPPRTFIHPRARESFASFSFPGRAPAIRRPEA